MTNSALATTPRRPAARRTLLAAGCLAVLGATSAQRLEVPALTAAEVAALPLAGVHVATLSADDAGPVSVLVPRPVGVADDDAAGGRLTVAVDDCLEPAGSQTTQPGEPLMLTVNLVADACETTLVTAFAAASRPALAAVAVALDRSTLPPLEPGVVLSALSLDRVSLPPAEDGAFSEDSAPLLHLRLTNAGAAPLRIDALLLADAYAAVAGRLFTLAQGGFDGSWTSLEAGEDGFHAVELAPGEAVEYALAVGVGTRLATGSWAVTLRPAFAVLVAGERRLLALEQASLVATPTRP